MSHDAVQFFYWMQKRLRGMPRGAGGAIPTPHHVQLVPPQSKNNTTAKNPVHVLTIITQNFKILKVTQVIFNTI